MSELKSAFSGTVMFIYASAFLYWSQERDVRWSRMAVF